MPLTSQQHDAIVRETIENLGPLPAFKVLTAANDVLIKSPDLDNGRDITMARCAIYRGLMAHWAEEQKHLFGYGRPFAVVALGGMGREEITPCSDQDFAFLFDDFHEAIKNSSWILARTSSTASIGTMRFNLAATSSISHDPRKQNHAQG